MAPGPCAHAGLWATGKAGGGTWVERPPWSGPAPLRPPCPLQRNPFSEGFPQEPPAARRDRPGPAWQEPSLSDPESTRRFPPAANKIPLSFTSLCPSVCLSRAPAGRDKAHRPLGTPGLPARPSGSGPPESSPTEKHCWRGDGARALPAGRAGAPRSTWPLSTAACDPTGWRVRRVLGSLVRTRRKVSAPSRHSVGTAQRIPGVPTRLPDCKHPPEFPEATCTLTHLAPDSGVPTNPTDSLSCKDAPQNSGSTVSHKRHRPGTAKYRLHRGDRGRGCASLCPHWARVHHLPAHHVSPAKKPPELRCPEVFSKLL